MGYEGAGTGIFSVIVVLLIVLCCMFLMARPLDGGNSGAAVTVSTVNRDPLPADACIESDKWFEDHSGWITSDSVLIRGLRSFYQDTGVQPYVIITDQVNGKGADLSDGEAELYLEETYDDLFQDEGHLIFLFMEYETGQYKEYLYIGNQASTVIDEEAQEIIYDYADYYYTSDLDDNEYFSTVFEEAGQRIMRKTTTSKDILLGVVIAVSVIAVISVCGYVLVKKKQADAKEAEEKRKILETPIENMEDIELKEKYSDKKE